MSAEPLHKLAPFLNSCQAARAALFVREELWIKARGEAFDGVGHAAAWEDAFERYCDEALVTKRSFLTHSSCESALFAFISAIFASTEGES